MTDRSNAGRAKETDRRLSGAGTVTSDRKKRDEPCSPTPETEEWVNEGGSLRPPRRGG